MLYLCFTEDAFQGVEVVKKIQQEPALASDGAINYFPYPSFWMAVPVAQGNDRDFNVRKD